MGWSVVSTLVAWVRGPLLAWVRELETSAPAFHTPTSGRMDTRLVIGPSDVMLIGPTEGDGQHVVPLTIAPARRAAWDDRGWSEQVDGTRLVYEGAYQIRRRNGQAVTFPGRIVVDGTSVVPYIADPPPAIKRHPKGPCFQLSQAPWFRVHWRRPAHNVDDALLYVERILAEVLP